MTDDSGLPRFDGNPDYLLSVAGLALLLGASVSVLYHIVDVAGDPTGFALVVAAVMVASTVLARFVRPAVAALVALGLLLAGANWYFLTLPDGIALIDQGGLLVRDSVALLSGLSVLQITNAGEWALAVAPGPIFLTWYLAIRGRYVGSTVVGGAFLGLFVLTGDARTMTALFGVVGAGAAVGFGELNRRDGSIQDADMVVVVLAAMVAATLTLGVIPAGAGTTFELSGPSTVESSLTATDDRIEVKGSISLSPKTRFTVESEAPDFWLAATYDRYTGRQWIRTGGERTYTRLVAGPEGPTQTVSQVYRAESRVSTMPAAWRPTNVSAGERRTLLTQEGALEPDGPLSAGDTYRVESEVLVSSGRELRQSGTDYPDEIRARYLQLPASTPDRVTDRTDRLTAIADDPYDKATVIERWLKNNKNYSLTVDRPDGDVADAFLFEMDAGYCTYFATTMVTMLRTQGIPARLAVGYTPGQPIDDNRYVVRGLDSHAWVQVYFPDHGWVRFDPTPPNPRRRAEQARIADARLEGLSNVDTAETRPTATPTTGSTNRTTPNTTDRNVTVTENVSDPLGPSAQSESSGGPELPSREQLGLGLVLLAGGVAGFRRTGLAARAYRELWVRRTPTGPPVQRVTGAYERVEHRLEQRHRPRKTGETVRQYLEDIGADARIQRLGYLHERAVYAGEVSADEADQAVAILREQVRTV